MNRPAAVNLAMVDDRLRSIDAPGTRALLERWMLTFACTHTRFPVDEALLLGWQWAQRCGHETIATNGHEPWCARPMPATAAEWSADGCVVDPDTLPLVLEGEDGELVEYHVLYDTVTVEEERSVYVEHSPELEPLAPHPSGDVHREFDDVLTYRERLMLSHLWQIGAVVGWDDPGEETLTRVMVEEYRGLPGPDILVRRLLIRPGAEGVDVMTLVLRFLAETAWLMVLGRHLGEVVEKPLAEVSTPLELGLAVEVTRQRTGVGRQYANMDAYRFLEEETGLPAPEELRWWLVFEVAQLMEDLLLGHGPGEDWDEEDWEDEDWEDEADDPEEIHADTLRHLDRLMAEVPEEKEDLVTSWLRDFVCDNPRFSTEQAVALGWQLYERFGDMMAENPRLRGRTGDLELRTEEEWTVRGRRVRDDACPLYAPGSHGGVVAFLLSSDTEVVDTLGALISDETDSDFFHHRAPTEDTPELESLHGYVSDYELDLLRNVTRLGIRPEVVYGLEPDDLALWSDEEEGQEVCYMPLVVDEDRSVMRMAMDRVMNILMADLLGEFEEAEFSDGRFVVSSTLLEEELAVLIAARRLGLEEEPVLDEAWDFFFGDVPPDDVRWGLVYRAAANLDHLMRGYCWNSSD